MHTFSDIYRTDNSGNGLDTDTVRQALAASLAGRTLRRVLILPPDFTRFHSSAGLITNLYYHLLTEMGATVDVMPALGTHVAMTNAQTDKMFGDIPHDRFLVHRWREDVTRIGEVPGDFLSSVTDGLWHDPIAVEINRRLLDPAYDLIISPGQVVPHEVIGMANHAKKLFVGVGGSEMINKSHMVGAVYGMERIMGKDHSPVRALFDYAFTHFLLSALSVPVLFVLTVCTAPTGISRMHGLFIGEGRACLEAAIALSQEKNIDFVPHGIQKCVAYLDPEEFHTTWLGNKAIYRTRMAIADGGELIILAPGLGGFGEDPAVDALIRKYGYRGRLHTLSLFEDPACGDLRQNMGAAAHLIHGSSDDRFRITYAVPESMCANIRDVGYNAADIVQMTARYNPARLTAGYNTLPDGEEIYFIPNPALGLWIDRERFAQDNP